MKNILHHTCYFFTLTLIFLSTSLQAEVLTENFSDEIAGFSISSPNAQWRLMPRESSPGPVRATLRFEMPVNQFYPNVTVRVMAILENKTDLDDWLEQDLKQTPKNIEILEKKKIAFGKIPSYELKFVDSKAGFSFLQRIFMHQGKRFIITGVAKTQGFERFIKDFEQIFDSLVILNP